MLRIDSHQHFWKISRGDYAWLSSELGVLYQDFLPQHIMPILEAQSVTQTILVQAADSPAETEFMLSLATEHNFIAGVVGWVDMASKQGLEDIHRLASNPYFKGIRPMLQDIDDKDWILHENLDACFHALVKHELTFDALVLPQHLSNLLVLAERYPQLSIVIDHGAKPNIPLGITHVDNQLWCKQILQLSANKNVYCKLSGLLTEAGNTMDFDTIHPFMQHLLACFGPQKLMWGSDWPVINLVSQYNQWKEMTTAFLAPLSNQDKQAIWATTAQTFYKL